MSGWDNGWGGGWDGGWQGPTTPEGTGQLQAQSAEIIGLGERFTTPEPPPTGAWAVLQPWAQATSGVFGGCFGQCFGGNWCQATSGIYCETTARPLHVVSPAPPAALKDQEWRDRRDLLDMLRLLQESIGYG